MADDLHILVNNPTDATGLFNVIFHKEVDRRSEVV
jgi:hypothetical protein